MWESVRVCLWGDPGDSHRLVHYITLLIELMWLRSVIIRQTSGTCSFLNYNVITLFGSTLTHIHTFKGNLLIPFLIEDSTPPSRRGRFPLFYHNKMLFLHHIKWTYLALSVYKWFYLLQDKGIKCRNIFTVYNSIYHILYCFKRNRPNAVAIKFKSVNKTKVCNYDKKTDLDCPQYYMSPTYC